LAKEEKTIHALGKYEVLLNEITVSFKVMIYEFWCKVFLYCQWIEK
jgi:hypothetical protein